jgi:DNA-binding FadR family transcriptional regulator
MNGDRIRRICNINERKNLMKKSQGVPLSERVAEKIIDLIKEQDLKPGDKLVNEFELAGQLKVGRSTVREAIKRLISRNILEIRQGAGTFISEKQGIPVDPLGLTFVEWDDKLALDLVDVRLMLEPEIAAIVATRATNDQRIRIMEQCIKVEEIIARNEDYGEEDTLFHRYLAEASGNKIIEKLIPIINSSVSTNIDVTNNELVQSTLISHREIAEAVMRHDYIGARNAMTSHLHVNRLRIIENKGLYNEFNK